MRKFRSIHRQTGTEDTPTYTTQSFNRSRSAVRGWNISSRTTAATTATPTYRVNKASAVNTPNHTSDERLRSLIYLSARNRESVTNRIKT